MNCKILTWTKRYQVNITNSYAIDNLRIVNFLRYEFHKTKIDFSDKENFILVKQSATMGEQGKGQIITDLINSFFNVKLFLKKNNSGVEIICVKSYFKQVLISCILSVLSGLIAFYLLNSILYSGLFFLFIIVFTNALGITNGEIVINKIVDKLIVYLEKNK